MTGACGACGATEQAEGARFCFSCGASLAAPGCVACDAPLVPPGARFCSGCGAEQTGAAPAPAARPAAARRVTSVLFADLVGFTTLSESRDTEDVRELLSRYFEESRLIIERYGGTVEKFIGDAVMAVWGVPTAHEDDAERAVRAGLELVGSVAELGVEVGIPDLSMRVGVVTGEVAVTVGATGQGMVAGDAVNTASRVQATATPGHVWVDETTRLLTASAITFADAGSHVLKGKAEPMPLWAVRAVVAGVRGAQRADGLEAPLVGRDREMRLVKEVFHGVEESRRPALLVVGGEAGVGKSRLGWEFEKYVDGLTRPVRWHNGRCLAYGEGVAFFALADALRVRLHVGRDEDGADAATLLAEGVERWVSDPEERRWLEPRLAALLGIAAAGSYQREDLFSAWTTFLHRVSEDQHPVVLLIDDAHHADDGLLAFVEHLMAVADFGCMVFLLARPSLLDEHPALAGNRRATVLHLEPLTDDVTATLLDGLVSGLPDQARDALVARAEGIPLYAVETVRSLIDRDLVVPRGGRYVLADPEHLDLGSVGAPASLQALVAARLDTLSPEQRRLVDRASVLGNSFASDEIGRLCPDIADLEQVLAALVRVQVLRRDVGRFSAEAGQFQFVQSVVRQVAYASLSRRERKSLHLAVAQDLAAHEDAGGELAAIIAQHFLEALDAVPDDPDVAELVALAVGQLRRAATRAATLGAPREAAAHLRHALARCTDPLEAASVEAGLAAVLRDAGDYPEAIEQATRARDLLAAAGLRQQAGAAAATLSRCLINLQRPIEALEVAQPWYDELCAVPEAAREALDLSSCVYSVYMRQGANTRDVCDQRIRLAELLGDEAAIADSYNSLAVHYAMSGAPRLGTVLIESAAARAREADNPPSLIMALLNLAAGLNGEDLSRALQASSESVELARRHGSAYLLSSAVVNLLVAEWAHGDWDTVVSRVDEERLEDGEWRAAAAMRAHIAHVRGEAWPGTITTAIPVEDVLTVAWEAIGELVHADRPVAPDLLERACLAIEDAYAISSVWDDFVFFWQMVVEVALEEGDDAALARVTRMVDEHRGSRPGIGLLAHRAALAATLGRREGAEATEVERHLREALAGYVEWGATPYAARARGELGRHLVEQGRAQEGNALLAQADEELARLGAQTWRAALASA